MNLTLSHLTYIYENAPSQALAPVTTTFCEGWTGIVGSNGCGKSTLLRLVCGELKPSSGQITPQKKAAYCAQETETRPKSAEDFALDYSKKAFDIKSILEIENDWVWCYDALSQGQRKRLQVAVALWLDLPVLALDEPTNHVDAPCRKRLLEALKNYKGIGLLVSHDREMLDALTQQCLFLSDSSALMRPGNYTEGKKQEQLEHTSKARERKDAKAERSRLQHIKARRYQEAGQAKVRRSKRHLTSGDKDAKARINLAIYTGQDGKAGKRARQMDARLALAEVRLKKVQLDKVYDADVWFDVEPSHRPVIVGLEEGCLSFGKGERLQGKERQSDKGWATIQKGKRKEEKKDKRRYAKHEKCLHIPPLLVGSHDHIAITGSNGAGKSTLISALESAVPSDIKVLYLPQKISIKERQAQVQALEKLSQADRGQTLSIVAQLNSEPERLLSGNSASPGETRKLMLALGILSKPQLIIMDEPTNHFDLISVEALERILAACPCAVVLVSHDKQFLSVTTSIEWHISMFAKGSLLTIR